MKYLYRLLRVFAALCLVWTSPVWSAEPLDDANPAVRMERENGAIHLIWKADTPGTIPLREGRGADFGATDRSGVSLGNVIGRDFWQHGLTVALVVQPTTLEQWRMPLCSKWISEDGLRAFELGLSREGRPYWQVSASGNADAQRKWIEGRHGLLPGECYALAAVFDPGKRMAIYVNGHLSAELTELVPGGIGDNSTPLILGGRSDGRALADAVLGDVWFYPTALDEADIRKWGKQMTLAMEPLDVRSDWERAVLADEQALPPVRALTHGPGPHWFGYYDKFQTDPTDRYVLSLEADFDLRVPEPEDVARIGMIDTRDGDRWIPLTETGAWNFQQGCMLQWRPGSDREILFNDREGDRFVCRVMDVKTREIRTLPLAIDQVHPDGKLATCQNFARAGALRRVVGYAVHDPAQYRQVAQPDDDGIWTMDLDTGEHQLVVSVARVAQIPYPEQKPTDRLYVAHTRWSPDGKRFLFFNRGDTIDSRITTINADGTDLRVVTYQASHYAWMDPLHLLIEIPRRGGFFVFKDDGSMQSELYLAAPPGHHQLLPGDEWMLSDTVPQGADRVQYVYLFNRKSGRIISIGHFPQPREYAGDVRCDNHPRYSRDGAKVIIDSAHGGTRQMYMIDISGIVKAPASGG